MSKTSTSAVATIRESFRLLKDGTPPDYALLGGYGGCAPKQKMCFLDAVPSHPSEDSARYGGGLGYDFYELPLLHLIVG